MDVISAGARGQAELAGGGRSSLTCIEGKYCNKSENPPEVVLKPCLCKSHFCGRCSLGVAVELREMLRPVVAEWSSVLMVTLTVDPKPFVGPLEAWRHVGQSRAVSVLMQHLRRKKLLLGREWLSVLEFHKSGWPHWHVLLHARFVPHEEVLKGWGLGHVSLTRTKDFQSTDHAVNYATKYVLKPDVQAPEWVLGHTGRIRKFSTSRGLLPSTQKRYEETEEKREYQRRTIADRMADCETTFNRFKVHADGRFEWAGTVRPLDEGHNAEIEADEVQRARFKRWLEGDTLESSHGGTKQTKAEEDHANVGKVDGAGRCAGVRNADRFEELMERAWRVEPSSHSAKCPSPGG